MKLKLFAVVSLLLLSAQAFADRRWPTSGAPAPLVRDLTMFAGSSTDGLFTDKNASFLEISNASSRQNIDLSLFSQFRVLVLNAGTIGTADVRFDCDADAAFGSPTTLGQLDNPAGSALSVGTWTAIPAGECLTAGGVYIRAGMLNGNSTEDPNLKHIHLQLR